MRFISLCRPYSVGGGCIFRPLAHPPARGSGGCMALGRAWEANARSGRGATIGAAQERPARRAGAARAPRGQGAGGARQSSTRSGGPPGAGRGTVPTAWRRLRPSGPRRRTAARSAAARNRAAARACRPGPRARPGSSTGRSTRRAAGTAGRRADRPPRRAPEMPAPRKGRRVGGARPCPRQPPPPLRRRGSAAAIPIGVPASRTAGLRRARTPGAPRCSQALRRVPLPPVGGRPVPGARRRQGGGPPLLGLLRWLETGADSADRSEGGAQARALHGAA